MSHFYRYSVAFGLLILCQAGAFSGAGQTTKQRPTEFFLGSRNSNKEANDVHVSDLETPSRRKVLKTAGAFASTALLPSVAEAAEQRCDPLDPRCGADGVLRDRIVGKSIPRVTNRITHVVQLVIDVGERREQVGFLRFGLYGDDCPNTVKTMLRFLTPVGITGVKKEDFENAIDSQTATVTLLEGGIVPEILPGRAIEFGIPSQKKAYARARGLREAPSTFCPQNRPESVSLQSEPSARKHDVAGLVSIPEQGIGYATLGGDVDGAYANAFLITADETPEFDAKKRRVIGQVIDNESMEFLARLSSLPVQKKGGKGGPPLLKVTILDTGVQKVGANNNSSSSSNNNNNQPNKKKK